MTGSQTALDVAPPRRMVTVAHLVWGASTAAAVRELRLARETILGGG